MRSIIQSTIVAKHPEIPLHAYFPSGPGALTKEIDGRTRKHTGTYILRIAKAYAMNFVNLFKTFASITGDGIALEEANLVVRVPVDANLHPASVIEQIFKQYRGASAKWFVDRVYSDQVSYKVYLADSLAVHAQDVGLNLGAGRQYLFYPLKINFTTSTYYAYGLPGPGAAELDMKPELAESLGISDDLITFSKAQGTSRAGVVISITVPFSQTTYDAIYRLLDIGQFAVYNSRVPTAKPLEVYFAATVLELQHMTGVPLVGAAGPAAIEGQVVAIDLSPGV